MDFLADLREAVLNAEPGDREELRARKRRQSIDVLIGVEVRQRRERSAVCVAELEWRPDEEQGELPHYLIRHLERLPPGTSFPALARRLGEIARSVEARGGDHPSVYANATGLGEPVIGLLRKASAWLSLTACYLTHGDRLIQEDRRVVRVGKAYLVAKMQTFLQTGQLHLLRTEEAETLRRELLDFEIRVEPDANERYGAFPVGTQDDLVNALGLALIARPPVRHLIY
jgi:hypothetical protein